jgi:hypothetical protein
MVIMIKFNVVLLLSLAAYLYGYSQNTDQHVIATAGNYAENGDYKISWTLGETVISTAGGGNYILTQGFQQSNWDIVDIEEVADFTHEIRLYPNPASSYVNNQ